MPIRFWIAILCALVAVIAFLVCLDSDKDDQVHEDAKSISQIASGLAILFTLWSSLVIIQTQDVGIPTAFGHPEGAISNGLHWKAPWEKVTRLDNKIQTDTYASNGYNGPDQKDSQGGCVSVRIARQATACVNVTIRWKIKSGGRTVDYLFRNYRSNDNIQKNLIHRDLQTAVNVAFATYDPLGLDPKTGDSTQPTSTQLSLTVQRELTDQVGEWIDVSKIFIPIFNFDGETQKRLNQLQLQVAQTRIAQQAEQTAAAQAAANRTLAASVSRDPNVLVSRCLDILNEAVQKGQPLPAGFSCFPGNGSGIAVAVK
jgi:regulator of protease activity HflC (stomatin/prohibitin superfamily)